MRLTQELLYEIEEEILSGTSLNALSRDLKIGKSTLYYYYKKLKGKQYQEPYVTPGYSEVEGEIVGIFAGDGSQYYDKKRGSYQVNVHFGVQNEKYARYVKTLYECFFRKRFGYYPSAVQIRLKVESKAIYNYFSTYIEFVSSHKHNTVHLHTCALPLPFLIGFIRGLFDTDGSIRYNTHDKVVRATFHTTSEALARDVCVILERLSIEHSRYVQNSPPYKRVYLVRIRTRAVGRFLNVTRTFKGKALLGA